MDILILNGPNLNLVGTREPETYGHLTMKEVIGHLKIKFEKINIHYYQTNHEGAIIDKLQEVGFNYDGIILNAGGYTHTSIAIHDCIRAITTPVLELHISDIYIREPYRQVSYIKDVAVHHIIGKGIGGYEEGVLYFMTENKSLGISPKTPNTN